MKRIKVSEATEIQLDWLVAKCEGVIAMRCGAGPRAYLAYIPKRSAYKFWEPTRNWRQSGPIIEREFITIEARGVHPYWFARMPYENEDDGSEQWSEESGPTPLIAAMRCFIVSKLGNEVEVPKELK